MEPNCSPPKKEALTCYVVTYNRVDLLEQTLFSILKSRSQSFRLVVLDNGTADSENLGKLIERVRERFPVELITFPTNRTGAESPFFFAVHESDTEYMMVFHDDDLLHPDYLGVATAELVQNNEISFVCSYGHAQANPDESQFASFNITGAKKRFPDLTSLVTHCLTINKGIYGSTVYRRDSLRSVDPVSLMAYGKIHDRVVWCECIQNGQAVFFEDNYVIYRLHEGQDTFSGDSGPFPNECFALLRYYRSILGSSLLTSPGRCFSYNQVGFLREMWKWPGIRARVGFLSFIIAAFKSGSASALVFLPRFIARRLGRLRRRESL
jgi:hypothetical protein